MSVSFHILKRDPKYTPKDDPRPFMLALRQHDLGGTDWTDIGTLDEWTADTLVRESKGTIDYWFAAKKVRAKR